MEGPPESQLLQLLNRWRDGDRAALDRLLEQIQPWLRREVSQAKGPRPVDGLETLDLVQGAVASFLQWGPRFIPRHEGEFLALLKRIATNELVDAQRRAARRGSQHLESLAGTAHPLSAFPMPSRPSLQPSQAAVASEEQGWIRLALQFLSPDDRRLLLASKVEGLEWAAIATELGMASPDAARMSAKRLEPRFANILRKVREGRLPELSRLG